MQVKILVDNNKSRIIGHKKAVHYLHSTMKLKAPGYFWSAAYRKRIWDGFIRYVTEAGTFSTGHLGWVIEECNKKKIKYKVEDQRDHFKDLHIVTEVGDMKMSGKYQYQADTVKAVLTHELHGIKFIRGILDEATNAGKNTIAAAIFSSFSKKRRGLFLIDNSVIYEQALKEFKELMPDEDIGECRGKKIRWGRITIAMVQTLGPKAKKDPRIKAELAKIDIMLIDECDSVIPKKQAESIFVNCYNCPIRVGLSGTPLSHKEKTRNLKVLAFLGPVIFKVTNEQLVKAGVSSKPYFKILTGNIHHVCKKEYVKEYRRGIIKNRFRNEKVWSIVRKQERRKRMPVLILFKNHLHAEYLLKHRPKDLEHLSYRVVHHKTEHRASIFKSFMSGEIDVLLASFIIKRGLNIGIMKTLINAAGGDSETNVVQILGRGLRKIEGVKEKIWVYDFWDIGQYLRRHSFHRVIYYKKQGFTVKELQKNK